MKFRLIVAFFLLSFQFSHAQIMDLSGLMPKTRDQTMAWWRDGFPGIVDGAPWRRVYRTGSYWFILDTESMKIPHLGSVATPVGEAPAADLDLKITANGKEYRCVKGGEWTRHTGPRVIESGRFLQRSDVTDLEFESENGERLNAETRFETVVWPDQLGLRLFARPGESAISPGEESFGRVTGGFGLDGTNRLDIPADQSAVPGAFTLGFWTFLPPDYKAGPHDCWLVGKNKNELGDGAFGIVLRRDGVPELIYNDGGGRDHKIQLPADKKHALKLKDWNHIVISYDQDTLRLVVNGQKAVEHTVGEERSAPRGGLTFGGRQDGSPNYPFRGIVDEIYLFDRALSDGEYRRLRNAPEADHSRLEPLQHWAFNDKIPASMTMPREKWETASIQVSLSQNGKTIAKTNELPPLSTDWHDASVNFDPVSFEKAKSTCPVEVTASGFESGARYDVTFEPELGWIRINLDGIEPIPPAGGENPSNDALERIKLKLTNPTDQEQTLRLVFEKTARGIRQKIGTPITGITAMIRDKEGHPTGIPVQISKNWHHDVKAGVYSGTWFHGISQMRVPADREVELELTIAYGHWGGVPAASHVQLSLIGWGSNQLWEQSALGSWGESICYEPEQVQRNCTVTDVRPVMVTSMSDRTPEWGWTKNVGGADFFRLFDTDAQQLPHTRMKSDSVRIGPCLTEVTYRGNIGNNYRLSHKITASLARRDDVICGTYQIRLNVTEPVEFSRFVIFQTGADTYITTQDEKFAVGNKDGLLKEWDSEWGGDSYKGEPIELPADSGWASLHKTAGNPWDDKPGAWANRGVVIRHWKAKLGGKEARPWVQEHGIDVTPRLKSSTLDILPPPGVKRLEPGDFVEATIELLIVPQFVEDYYGPNQSLRDALGKGQNTWEMIHRQADGDHYQVEMKTGKLKNLYPGITIEVAEGAAEFELQGGLAYIPITFEGLKHHAGFELKIDGKPFDQSVHGNDFWQTDYDTKRSRWSRTYNIPSAEGKKRLIRFGPK